MKTNLLIVAGLLGISSVGFGRTDEVSQTMEFRDVAALIERKITEHFLRKFSASLNASSAM